MKETTKLAIGIVIPSVLFLGMLIAFLVLYVFKDDSTTSESAAGKRVSGYPVGGPSPFTGSSGPIGEIGTFKAPVVAGVVDHDVAFTGTYSTPPTVIASVFSAMFPQRPHHVIPEDTTTGQFSARVSGIPLTFGLGDYQIGYSTTNCFNPGVYETASGFALVYSGAGGYSKVYNVSNKNGYNSTPGAAGPEWVEVNSSFITTVYPVSQQASVQLSNGNILHCMRGPNAYEIWITILQTDGTVVSATFHPGQLTIGTGTIYYLSMFLNANDVPVIIAAESSHYVYYFQCANQLGTLWNAGFQAMSQTGGFNPAFGGLVNGNPAIVACESSILRYARSSVANPTSISDFTTVQVATGIDNYSVSAVFGATGVTVAYKLSSSQLFYWASADNDAGTAWTTTALPDADGCSRSRITERDGTLHIFSMQYNNNRMHEIGQSYVDMTGALSAPYYALTFANFSDRILLFMAQASSCQGAPSSGCFASNPERTVDIWRDDLLGNHAVHVV